MQRRDRETLLQLRPEPTSSPGTGIHQGKIVADRRAARRQRKNTAAAPRRTRSGSTVTGSNGTCTSARIAMPKTPMNPADSPGDMEPGPTSATEDQQGRQGETGSSRGNDHSGSVHGRRSWRGRRGKLSDCQRLGAESRALGGQWWSGGDRARPSCRARAGASETQRLLKNASSHRRASGIGLASGSAYEAVWVVRSSDSLGECSGKVERLGACRQCWQAWAALASSERGAEHETGSGRSRRSP